MTTESVDAQSTDTAEPADAASEMIPKSEAEKAFKRRDEALNRARELEAKLAERTKADADAERAKAEQEGDLRKQLDLKAAEHEAVTTKLTELENLLNSERAGARKSRIESGLLAGVDQAAHAAILAMYRGMADTLDDGEAEAAAVVKGAQKELKKLAPQLFQSTPQAPTQGLFSSTASPVSAKQVEKDLANQGFTGVKKLI